MTPLRKIYRASPALAITGWVHVVLLVAMLAVAPFDHRLVLGINPWFKPMKFAVSIVIYVWTVAWMLEYLPRPQRWIEGGISASMIVEIVCIGGQAARGALSHFNAATPFDTAVFVAMGIAVAVNTILSARLLWLYSKRVPLPPAILWGVRLGLTLFLIGSMDGFAMIAHGAHTVGLADGGPGLPGVNWSTMGGDLRVAHFLGLHGLQLMPLAGWYFDRNWRGQAVKAVFTLFTIWLVILGVTLIQAVSGNPLIRV